MHCGPSCYNAKVAKHNELTTSRGALCSATAHARSRVALPNGDFAAAVSSRCRAPPFSVAPRSPLIFPTRRPRSPRRPSPLPVLLLHAADRTPRLLRLRPRYQVAAMDHGFGGGSIWIRAAVAVAAGAAIAARAVRRKSVDSSAVFVGVPAMVAHTIAGYRLDRGLFSKLPFRRKGLPVSS